MTDERALSFGSGVEAYEAGRPEYADDHVAWLLDGVDGRVLDLAAGSGKLTRTVARLGHDVVAVDPDAEMLSRVGDLRTLVGTAERIPLADHSVAAVTVGQAWHWFDHERAGRELARVLVPGGRLGVVWNVRDVSQPFAAALTETMGGSLAEQMVDAGQVVAPEGFADFEHTSYSWMRELTRDDVLSLVASRSAYLIADEATRAATLTAVGTLLSTHPHTAGKYSFGLQMATHCYRSDLV